MCANSESGRGFDGHPLHCFKILEQESNWVGVSMATPGQRGGPSKTMQKASEGGRLNNVS